MQPALVKAAMWTAADLKLQAEIGADASKKLVEETDSAIVIVLQCVDAYTWNVGVDRSMTFAEEFGVVGKNDGPSLHSLQHAGPEVGWVVKGGVGHGTEDGDEVEPVSVDEIEVEEQDAEFEAAHVVSETVVADTAAVAYVGDEAELSGVVYEAEDKTEAEFGDKPEAEEATAHDVEVEFAAVD